MLCYNLIQISDEPGQKNCHSSVRNREQNVQKGGEKKRFGLQCKKADN